MANTQPPRNPNLKSNVRIRTIIAVAAFTLGAFGLLIYQLYALQLRDAEHYRTEAVTQQLQDTELPATRGNIYSANGKLLAKSNTVWNIIADRPNPRRTAPRKPRSAPPPSISPSC